VRLRFLVAGLASLVAALPAAAQNAPNVLTLAQALEIARRNNPTYQQAVNSRSRAAAQRRTAYGALLPSVNTNFGVGLREGRQQFFAGVPIGISNNSLNSSLGFSAGLDISPGVLFGLRSAEASFDAADQSVDLADLQLRQNVTVQFLTALQARARVTLRDTLLASAKTQLAQAEARAKAGLATDLDVRRSQVSVGQQEVQLLQAQSQAQVELFRLFQQLGVEQPEGIALSAELPLEPLGMERDALMARAMARSPELQARRAELTSALQAHRATQTQYLPTLSFGANVSSISQRLQGTPPPQAVSSQIGDFPFSVVRQPYTVSAGLSLPIFNGFQREQQIQVAAANRRDAEARVRAAELSVTATVVSQYTALLADFRAVEINRQNEAAARQALTLAEERYRLGLASLVDLVQVRAEFEQASNDLINSIYQYHRDFVQLEAVTGPLR
jgi:outer membrane protein